MFFVIFIFQSNIFYDEITMHMEHLTYDFVFLPKFQHILVVLGKIIGKCVNSFGLNYDKSGVIFADKMACHLNPVQIFVPEVFAAKIDI